VAYYSHYSETPTDGQLCLCAGSTVLLTQLFPGGAQLWLPGQYCLDEMVFADPVLNAIPIFSSCVDASAACGIGGGEGSGGDQLTGSSICKSCYDSGYEQGQVDCEPDTTGAVTSDPHVRGFQDQR